MADGTPTNFSSEVVGKTLTKADFVESVYSKIGGLSRRDSAEIVDLLFEAVKETLSRGEPVKISGFGNFVVREKKARVGRNPQTGRDIEISARRVLTFKPSQVLKDQLNT
ncbi:MAG: integration host factor subunit alpha [Deltaproteobacteria bacterium]|jgi:integration host factor subunit alpha|nr:integration host factor subunit alpha [Deltaproteobacteria bacterium]